ncbi:hypothetical protein SAMD00019534_017820, partial [Acytostelium subglobosum LB1]|uniref:hypothetical protein n=1 Tax=Acytostelium subglobosum LB1 TaxID=1410327 RepID=UPI00064495FD
MSLLNRGLNQLYRASINNSMKSSMGSLRYFYTEIQQSIQFKQVLAENKMVIVDFHAPWCGPCRVLNPLLESTFKDNKIPDIKLAKVDIDEVGSIAEEFQVSSIPTLIAFKDGMEVHRIIGAPNPTGLNNFIEQARSK